MKRSPRVLVVVAVSLVAAPFVVSTLVRAPVTAPVAAAPQSALAVPAGAPIDALASHPDAPRPDAPRPDRSCKPSGPIAVELVPLGDSGGVEEVGFSIRPARELRAVRWELELGGGVTWVEGALAGEAAGGRDAPTEGRVRLLPPPAGRYGRARLLVHAVLPVIDEGGATADEPFTVSRTLAWGAPEPVGSVVQTRDAESGELLPVVVLSTSHRPGR